MSIQKATGNMYEWVDYVHSYLRGECPYQCPYCYVRAIAKRFDNKALQGPLRFDEKELKANYGAEKYNGKTIFVEHTHDLFHPKVKTEDIIKVVYKCWENPQNAYVFQTRNPMRIYREINVKGQLPRVMLGTTIETDKRISATTMQDRALALWLLKDGYSGPTEYTTFVTIEPILTFHLPNMIQLLERARPDFINIGADSKGTGLEEPTAQEIRDLIAAIKNLGIEIRTKRNLDRILNPKKGTPCPSK
jgi:DNA repair photolyase